MAVPFIDLKRFEPGFLDRWYEITDELTRNTQFVGGPRADALEKALSERLGVAHTIGCANGTDALQLALRASGVGVGDLVVVPDATFWATFEAVVNVGARVVTVDIDPSDLQMDFELFRRAVETHRPKAAILVHLYGWGSARLDAFRALAAEHGVTLIEDGAQAVGAFYKGRSIYDGCKLATTSFYPAKVLGSCGDAGAVFAADADTAETVRRLGNHGRTSHYGHGLVGWNSRLGGFDAAYLLHTLDYLDARLDGRRALAARYRERLDAMGCAERGIEVVAPPTDYVENGYLNVLRVDPARRGALMDGLKEAGIGCATVYPGAMSKQPGAAPFLDAAFGGDEAHALSESVLNLPLFAGMTEDEQDEVLQAFASLI